MPALLLRIIGYKFGQNNAGIIKHIKKLLLTKMANCIEICETLSWYDYESSNASSQKN